jgi:hypothetical protein
MKRLSERNNAAVFNPNKFILLKNKKQVQEKRNMVCLHNKIEQPYWHCELVQHVLEFNAAST